MAFLRPACGAPAKPWANHITHPAASCLDQPEEGSKMSDAVRPIHGEVRLLFEDLPVRLRAANAHIHAAIVAALEIELGADQEWNKNTARCRGAR